MPRIKLPRKSTSIDMTAMCDVAFLLLSFFILTTKFKPSEALSVVTPNSVSTVVAPQKEVVWIIMDKSGKVFFSVSDDGPKKELIEALNQNRKLGLTPAEMKAFERQGSYVGVPFSKLKSYLQLGADEVKNAPQEGIPVTDTLHNELTEWMTAAKSAFAGGKMNLLVRGDNEAKYPSFKGVIDAFKKNDLMKFQMVTNPEGAPPGTALYRKNNGPAAK